MDDYENLNPVEAIMLDMEENGWINAKIAQWTGFPRSRITEYLTYQRKLPISFIRQYVKLPNAAPLSVMMREYELGSGS